MGLVFGNAQQNVCLIPDSWSQASVRGPLNHKSLTSLVRSSMVNPITSFLLPQDQKVQISILPPFFNKNIFNKKQTAYIFLDQKNLCTGILKIPRVLLSNFWEKSQSSSQNLPGNYSHSLLIQKGEGQEGKSDFALGKVWGSLAQERILLRTETIAHTASSVWNNLLWIIHSTHSKTLCQNSARHLIFSMITKYVLRVH